MESWTELCQYNLFSLGGRLPTTLVFDTHSELLWYGTQDGIVASLRKPFFQKYTSIWAHTSPVVKLMTCEKGVLSLSKDFLHFSSRRGIQQWLVKNETANPYWSCCFSTENDVYLSSGKMIHCIDLERGVTGQEIATSDICTHLTKGRLICGGSQSGHISIFDPKSKALTHRFNAYSGHITDISAQGNLLLTAGHSLRPNGSYLERLVKVYDIRTLRPLRPISFSSGPSFISMHPKFTSTAFIASSLGQFEFTDIGSLSENKLLQANVTDYVEAVSLATSGEAMALVDRSGTLILWGQERPRFSEFYHPIELGVEPLHNETPVPIDELIPLNIIGMPYYTGTLLSSWPATMIFQTGLQPPVIDSNVISQLPFADSNGFIPFPKAMKRYRAEKSTSRPLHENQNERSIFKSEQAKQLCTESLNTSYISPLDNEVAAPYRRVEIKYSKFGIDDFDFSFYNKTEFTGFETNIPNSYCNALLQVYFFSPAHRNLALAHSCGPCDRPHCFLCELGFVFQNLLDSKGQASQCTNFSRLIDLYEKVYGYSSNGTIVEAEALAERESLFVLIQRFNVFLGRQIYIEGDHPKDLFMELATIAKCPCGAADVSQRQVVHSVDMRYPRKIEKPGPRSISFLGQLRSSIVNESHFQAYCQRCQSLQVITTTHLPLNLPDVLNINTSISTLEQRAWWSSIAIPKDMTITVQNNSILCYEGRDTTQRKQVESNIIKVAYELAGVVMEIQNDGTTHLVNVAKVFLEPESPWYLFNDFHLSKIKVEQALDFSLDFLSPAILLYRKIGSSFKTQEDVELHSNGTRSIIRPKRLRLARVSCLRGYGDHSDAQIKPFIDDYILVEDCEAPILDYLTEFSGIKKEDLLPEESRRTLVPLKFAFKKLRLLANLGCIFVGHGLSKDFRIINIHVPREQVIDTVDLFYLSERQRKLSLKYLAWYVLKKDIQKEMHDSIQDASCALELNNFYQNTISEAGSENFVRYLVELYSAGRKHGFKPPIT